MKISTFTVFRSWKIFFPWNDPTPFAITFYGKLYYILWKRVSCYIMLKILGYAGRPHANNLSFVTMVTKWKNNNACGVKKLIWEKYVMRILLRTEKLHWTRLCYFQNDWTLPWLRNGARAHFCRVFGYFWIFLRSHFGLSTNPWHHLVRHVKNY